MRRSDAQPGRAPGRGEDAGAAPGDGGDAPRIRLSVEGAVDAEPEARPSAGGPGFHLYGVVRLRNRRGRGVIDDDVVRVRFRDLEALAAPAPFDLPPLEKARVRRHQRLVERVMRRCTILPAPYGVIFRERRALVGFLRDQYLALDEGLSFLDGHWEMRLHITATAAGEPAAELSDRAMHVFSELRRYARAAIPFGGDGRRLLTAAFLVERTVWIDFVERADNLSATQAGLTVDVTGPWPPYDFVRIV